MDLDALAQERVMCPRCEARPGEPCVTVSGKTSPRLHSARDQPLYNSWRDGYKQGRKDADEVAEKWEARFGAHDHR